MASLERRSAGGFDIDRSLTIAELENMSESERVDILMPIESLFGKLEKVVLPEPFCSVNNVPFS